MPNREELEISISNTGEVTINVLGHKGKSCLNMTKDLEESLGIIKAIEKKPEFYQQEEKSSTSIYLGGHE